MKFKLLFIAISIIGLALIYSGAFYMREFQPEPIPVCTRDGVSGTVYCGDCHEKGEF